MQIVAFSLFRDILNDLITKKHTRQHRQFKKDVVKNMLTRKQIQNGLKIKNPRQNRQFKKQVFNISQTYQMSRQNKQFKRYVVNILNKERWSITQIIQEGCHQRQNYKHKQENVLENIANEKKKEQLMRTYVSGVFEQVNINDNTNDHDLISKQRKKVRKLRKNIRNEKTKKQTRQQTMKVWSKIQKVIGKQGRNIKQGKKYSHRQKRVNQDKQIISNQYSENNSQKNNVENQYEMGISNYILKQEEEIPRHQRVLLYSQTKRGDTKASTCSRYIKTSTYSCMETEKHCQYQKNDNYYKMRIYDRPENNNSYPHPNRQRSDAGPFYWKLIRTILQRSQSKDRKDKKGQLILSVHLYKINGFDRVRQRQQKFNPFSPYISRRSTDPIEQDRQTRKQQFTYSKDPKAKTEEILEDQLILVDSNQKQKDRRDNRRSTYFNVFQSFRIGDQRILVQCAQLDFNANQDQAINQETTRYGRQKKHKITKFTRRSILLYIFLFCLLNTFISPYFHLLEYSLIFGCFLEFEFLSLSVLPC